MYLNTGHNDYPKERYSHSSISEPNWRDDFKTYARIDFTAHDALISSHLQSSREWFEEMTGILTVSRTVTLTLDTFPCGVIELKQVPVSSVASVGYIDTTGSSQTWSSSYYVVDLGDATHFARIQPIESETYPLTDDQLADVTITYTAGYSDITTMPRRFRDTIFSYAEDLYNGLPGPSEKTLGFLAACGGRQYA